MSKDNCYARNTEGAVKGLRHDDFAGFWSKMILKISGKQLNLSTILL